MGYAEATLLPSEAYYTTRSKEVPERGVGVNRGREKERGRGEGERERERKRAEEERASQTLVAFNFTC